MKAYEWMVKSTQQTEWVDRRGVLVWLAEVSNGLGSGLYLVSLYFNSLWGMFIGVLIIVVLKCGLLFFHLRQPLRFWRLVLKPGTSWLARGFIFVVLFIGFGAIQLALSYWSPGTAWEVAFKVVAGILAILVAAYTGFVMNYVKGIPFWNSAVLPLLFISLSILSGLAVFVVIGLFGDNVDIVVTVRDIELLLVINAIFVTVYLWSATYMGLTAKLSVKELIQGRLAHVLWIGVALFGMVIPLSIFSYFASEASPALLTTAIVCVLIGVFSLNYCLLKGALYSPLIPR